MFVTADLQNQPLPPGVGAGIRTVGAWESLTDEEAERPEMGCKLLESVMFPQGGKMWGWATGPPLRD